MTLTIILLLKFISFVSEDEIAIIYWCLVKHRDSFTYNFTLQPTGSSWHLKHQMQI